MKQDIQITDLELSMPWVHEKDTVSLVKRPPHNCAINIHPPIIKSEFDTIILLEAFQQKIRTYWYFYS